MNLYFANEKEDVTNQERRHAKLARQAAAEGMVLLENRNGLPLKAGERLALFGNGARQTLICGLGAASMNYRQAVNIEEGLKLAGFEITSATYLAQAEAALEKEIQAYYEWLRGESKEALIKGVLAMYTHPFVPARQKLITLEDIQAMADTAVYVISRNAGEGADRKNVPGDYQLLEDEKQNLKFLDAHFERVIVLLNTVGAIDTKFIAAMRHLKALLFVGLGGNEAGNAVADVLLGKTAPQGKLTATWAKNYEDYPNALAFGENNGNLDDELYSEGIFVGYRYFDSFLVGAAYPFGYGLTYADFRIEMSDCEQRSNRIFIHIRIQNTSNEYSGREVAQAYVSAPQGEASKPYQSLAGYAKSSLLAPGQSEELEVELDCKSMAFYSTREAAWVLDAGDYLIRLGNSSQNTKPAGIIRIAKRLILEQCKNLFPLDVELEEWATDARTASEEAWQMAANHILELDGAKFQTVIHKYRENKEPMPPQIAQTARDKDPERLQMSQVAKGQFGRMLTLADVAEGGASLDELIAQLSLDEMAMLCVGNVPDEAMEASRASVMAAGTAARRLAENENYENHIVPGASETTGALQSSRRVPKLNLADGGSGLRLVAEYEVNATGELLTNGLFSIRGVDRIAGKKAGCRQYEGSKLYYQYTTALPMATILAQTWDADLLMQCGEMVGRELASYGVDLWLAPSMNIHRNPLGGRNFEYYSEDPLVTGICGSAMTHGVELYQGVGATIKHLACNNQEANRGATNAHVSERALREIYLRGYERVIRQEKPTSMMTSLNLINGVHAANSFDMLTSFARDESHFDGLVMTDWGATVSDPTEHNKYPCSSIAGCIVAGNDLIMPGTRGDVEGIKSTLQNGDLQAGQLQKSVKRILKVMLRLHRNF